MNNGFLRPGELARLAGVSTDTLHHYERVGVLPIAERGGNGYRQYDPESVERIAAIQQALHLGFTLQELARFYAAKSSGNPPCHQVRALAAEKLDSLRERIAALQRLEGELEGILGTWDERLSANDPATAPARLLEDLGIERPATSGRPPKNTLIGRKQ